MQAKSFPRIYRLSLLTAVIVLVAGVSGIAQNPSVSESPAAKQMRALNNSLLQLHGRMQGASSSDGTLLNSQAAPVIAQRAAALTKLMQQDAHAALQFAFSPELASELAGMFPQSASQLESRATITGTVQHWIGDYPRQQGARSVWQMSAGSRTVSLYFAGPEPVLPKNNQRLQVTGVVVGSNMAVESSVLVESNSAANRNGPQRIAERYTRSRAWPFLAISVLGFTFVFPNGMARRRLTAGLKQFRVFALIPALVFASTPGTAQNSCSTTGPQNTAVLLVNLPGGSLPAAITVPAMQDVFFASNTPGVSLDGFLREASYGQTSATGGVFGPYNLTGTYSSCSDVGGSMLNDAIAAAVASGVNMNSYTRLFLIFPDIFGCGWQGFAAVGSCSQASTSGTFNLSASFLSAAYMTPRSSGVQIASHEIGHNFGLLHSGTLTSATPTDVIGPLTSPGTETDLGDYWSTMGEAVLGLYTSPQKTNTLGWLSPSANVQTVTGSGTFTLQPLETSPAGEQVLKVQRGSNNPGYYLWVEYREPLGNYDSTLLNFVYSGALIHYQDPTMDPAHSYLPNFTPSDTTDNNPELKPGQTWTDPYSNLSISTVSATTAGLTVNVNYGAVPCTTSAPTVSVSPLNPSMYPGQTVTYGLTVTDNDSSGCSASTINFGSTEPSGWSTSFSASSVTLNPGQSSSLTMYKGAPSGTAAATYAVNVNATTPSASAAQTANATVITAPPLAATVSVSGSTFTAPGTVTITSTVTSNGSPASGASVSFTLTNPNGGTTTQSATTNSSGVATWNYKLNGKSAPGNYSVMGKASLGSGTTRKNAASTQAVTSNTANFMVQ